MTYEQTQLILFYATVAKVTMENRPRHPPNVPHHASASIHG